jgi:hypothetical protein
MASGSGTRTTEVIISSVVSGIHRTKVGGHREIPLLLVNDDTIPNIDPNCVVVRYPEIDQIPSHLHQAVTYPKNPGTC